MTSKPILQLSESAYKYGLKPLLFTIDPEQVHERMTTFGEQIGKSQAAKKLFSNLFCKKYSELEQDIDGIHFLRPVGLSAGFDYDARLTQVTPTLGFGFHTVGTITRYPYGGNTRPILGRLPQSHSLMVNKGFKNLGVECIVSKLSGLDFSIPIGISIGRTNSIQLTTHAECVADIVSTFIICEQSSVKHSYYELNISCPNLITPITFYEPEKLHQLLYQLDVLGIHRPVYIKMPIELDNKQILSLLNVIKDHCIHGVVFGNLQKNRQDPSLNQHEVKKFSTGYFSGKPTEKRSNELIALTYVHYKDRFTIIGTGGIFSPEDAYKKIKLGASVVQLITGMIYQGPQLISQINEGIVSLLRTDGYTHISQARGAENKA